MIKVGVERVDITDLSTADAEGEPNGRSRNWPRRSRPAPRVLVVALTATLLAGLVGARAVHEADLRSVAADTHLTLRVVRADANVGADEPVGAVTEAHATVTLTLRVSVPVRVVAAELDGAPPVSRPPGTSTPQTRNPSVTVSWRVLCAEVGTIPGPRLLDIDVRSGAGVEHRRVRLATTDDDPVSRVFRLQAAQECAADRD